MVLDNIHFSWSDEQINDKMQAIKDAEADEQLADQLAELHGTLTRLADQEAATEAAKDSGRDDPQQPSANLAHVMHLHIHCC